MQPLEQKSLLATNRPEWSTDIRRHEEEYEMDSSFGQRMEHSQPSNASSYVENGLHPVPESASDKIVGGPQYHQYKQYSQVPTSGGQPIEPVTQKRRICGVGKAVFVLWCILGFLLAVLCVVAGVFGSMIARQDERILELKNVAATQTTQPDTNATSTTAAPAATTTWVEVANWEYIGCYLDSADRAFPDKYTLIDNQTNRLCAAACADYEYFGTQFGDQCYCSSTPPETAAPAWNCDMHCNGAQTSEICGGYFFLSAWKKKTT
ncbi:Wsc domain containing protein [Colletotrichum higginsianum IMI 349063]|uniref:Wsc domain containing protein n=3 Tax=Colletotrichum higginsianum TaxID=80884 RepID=A0A1B7YFM7_COLHI|nr:Wsc domain containing protein [Colletotrichum higginsianum IMI 349063]OBR10815.1 Wsc domain containing protein [Colletotrichum higginsianum IMI 349063]